jgi:hypothetical protein
LVERLHSASLRPYFLGFAIPRKVPYL